MPAATEVAWRTAVSAADQLVQPLMVLNGATFAATYTAPKLVVYEMFSEALAEEMGLAACQSAAAQFAGYC